MTSIREIKLLKALHHPNLVALHNIAVGRKPDSIFLVFEYCSHDMASLIDKHTLATQSLLSSSPSSLTFYTTAQLKRIMYQLLSGVAYLHAHYVMHRDLKLSNLLLNAAGVLKIADFGLARVFSNPLDLYTPKVVTLWYRAPELLLGSSSAYHSAIDMWSCGCIFAELVTGRPVFAGQTEAEQLELICRLLGTPNDKIWPGFQDYQNSSTPVSLPHYPYSQLTHEYHMLSSAGLNLLSRLLTYDPSKRITASKALQHPWFSEQPLPLIESEMPSYGAINTLQHQQQQDTGSSKKKRKIVDNNSTMDGTERNNSTHLSEQD